MGVDLPFFTSGNDSIYIPSKTVHADFLPSDDPTNDTDLAQPINYIELPTISGTALECSPFIHTIASTTRELPLVIRTITTSVFSDYTTFSTYPRAKRGIDVSPSTIQGIGFQRSILPIYTRPYHERSTLYRPIPFKSRTPG